MAQSTTYLIDQLDQAVRAGAGLDTPEQFLTGEAATAEWKTLVLAVDAIRETGLNDQVAAARHQYEMEQQAVVKPAPVRRMYSTLLRVAACVAIVLAGVAVYQYASVNANGEFNKAYFSYELNASRGDGQHSALESAYRQKQWNEVLTVFGNGDNQDNKAWFLAGAAEMELRHYPQAAGYFQHILEANKKTGDNYFQDEAEFYLAMTRLADGQAKQAVPLIEKIKAEPAHTYHNQASRISATDLKIMEWKAK